MVFERVGLGATGIVFKQADRRGLPAMSGDAGGIADLDPKTGARPGMNIARQMMPVMGHSSPWAALIGGLFCVF
jgi:hypothetical protein